ncbi:Bcr/CflA family drug resistance efflux transporter, partial [Streptomyces sp. NPDC059828]
MPASGTATQDQSQHSVVGARRVGFLVVLVLGGLTALPPLSMDMYLPALPQVTGALNASAATIQLTLTACLAG